MPRLLRLSAGAGSSPPGRGPRGRGGSTEMEPLHAAANTKIWTELASRGLAKLESLEGVTPGGPPVPRIEEEEWAALVLGTEPVSDGDLARLADRCRAALHPDGAVTYVVDRNINYTNV